MKWWFRRGVGDQLREGDRAMQASKWSVAAGCYARVVARQPANAPIWVQYGHALKELGDVDGAIDAYRHAVELTPQHVDNYLHLGESLERRQRTGEAVDAFAAALNIDPDCANAYASLVRLGGRDRLPDGFQRNAYARGLADLTATLRETRRRVEDWVELSTYPLSAYDSFRHDFIVKPPPAPVSGDDSLSVIVDARNLTAYFARATLVSLLDQDNPRWNAIVIADPNLLTHPVASLASDDRIAFHRDPATTATASNLVLHISAGTTLDRTAIGWFLFAAGRTQCRAAWCDSDHGVEHWRDAVQFERPELWGVFDLDIVAQTRSPPAAVLVRGAARYPSTGTEAAEHRRTVLIDAAGNGSIIAHIPRILATVLRLPEIAEEAPAGHEAIGRWSTMPNGSPPPVGKVPGTDLEIMPRPRRVAVSVARAALSGERLHVIIPTRDAFELLAKAVDTLFATAAHPERIDLTIVDNRSELASTASYLEKLQRERDATVLPLDEPFNWARANNLAVARSTAPHLVFANNDIEMLSRGWDDLMVGYLNRRDVGIVGARLLYPDGSLQHGGILLGLGSGQPIHDGLKVDADETGPQDRFDVTHCCAAVTGAFMGVRRDVFERLRGFDELRLAVAYNDIDLCLKARSLDLRVLYAPAIELIHHESKTRGLNDVRAKVAWDQGELAATYARWTADLVADPGYNPHWSTSRAYDGYREPTSRQILEHLDRSARLNPWRTAANA